MGRTKTIDGILYREVSMQCGETFWAASFVKSKDGPVNMIDLPEEVRARVAGEINAKAMNALYEGAAEFRVKQDT